MKNKVGKNNNEKYNFYNRFRYKLKSEKYFNNIFMKKSAPTKKINLNNEILKKNISKYNTNQKKFDIILVNNLIENKNTHIKALIKDNNIINNRKEYLKGFYKYKEIILKFNKFYSYYKNYFKFFLKPILTDLIFCEILKKSGNLQAQYFYEKYKNKNKRALNKNNINNFSNKKILLSNIIEKNNNNNISSIYNANDNNISKNGSSISLLSIINLMNTNNKKEEKKENNENDVIKKKINLFLNYNKNENKNLTQKSTTVLTPQNKSKISVDKNKFKAFNNIQIINKSNIKSYVKSQSGLIKKNNINNINNNNDIICLSERITIEQKDNEYIRDKIIKNYTPHNSFKAINNNTPKQNTPSNIMNYNHKISYNLKYFNPMINNEKYFLLSNYNWHQRNNNSSTQIKKVVKKSPFFRNSNNLNNNISSKNINTKISNKLTNFKSYFRNRIENVNGYSLIYYQKLKSGI